MVTSFEVDFSVQLKDTVVFFLPPKTSQISSLLDYSLSIGLICMSVFFKTSQTFQLCQQLYLQHFL